MSNQLPRLSDVEYIILKMLVSEPGNQWYGLDLVNKSEGRVKKGTVYVTLQRMEEKGLVSSEREEISAATVIPRRIYKPTPSGVHIWNAVTQFQKAMRASPVFA